MRLPPFLLNISPIGETLAAFEAENGHLEAEAAARNAQLTVSTADTGLVLWERDYSLPSHGAPASRRGRIRAAMTAGGQPMTPDDLRQLAITVGGAGAVSVVEDFANCRVVVEAVFPDAAGLAALEEAIQRFKPAHLQVLVNPTVALTGTLALYPVLSGGLYVELTGRAES